MKAIRLFAVLASLLLAASACQEEPSLTVSSTSSINLGANGSSDIVSFTSNRDWTATASESWVSVYPSSGSASESVITVTVSAQANTTYEDRSATVTITADGLTQTIQVRQPANEALIVANKSFELACEATSFEVEVQTNVDYNVSISDGWIRQISSKGLKTDKLVFSVSENDSYDARTAKVTIKPVSGDAEEQVVSVRQAQKDAVLVEDTVFNISCGGGDIEVAVSANVEFEVSSAADWIHYIETRSLSNYVVRLRVDANPYTDDREGTVTISQKGSSAKYTITVKQAGKDVLTVGEVKEVAEEGGIVEVDIQYNIDYTVEVDYYAQDWITYIETKAPTSGKLRFMLTPNDKDDIRTGNVTIRPSGSLDPVTLTFRQQSKLRRLLTEFFGAMDGPNWAVNDNWGTDESIFRWWGIIGNSNTGITGMQFRDMGLKGSIPACIGDFPDLDYLFISNEPGIVGALPESFSKLVKMRELVMNRTSMTSLPDVFADMPNLKSISIVGNTEMTGPLPESIGRSDNLGYIGLHYNAFTGTVPKSYVRWVDILNVYDNRLTGKLSDIFTEREDIRSFVRNSNLWQQNGYGFDISDIEIPGFYGWFDGQISGTDGSLFTFDDVVGKSKYTVYVIWASWCPFSRTLMPALKEYYENYRQDGLEIIATSQVGGVDEYGVGHMISDRDAYMAEVVSKGYDQWYNFYWPDYGNSYLTTTPNAEVYDQNGNILFSSFENYPDPVRNRYGKVASTQLIPFLETLFGPASPADPYTSSDYSKDGQVLTLQKASVGKGINIVFMGDAYTDKDMGSGGVYETVMKQAMEEFFAVEPYKTYRNRFNVYAVKVVSKNGRIGSGYTTALGTRFGSCTYVEGDDDKCFEYAMKVPGINSRENLLVSVLVNSNHNAGTAFLFRNNQSAVARVPSFGNDPDAFGSTLQHEAGGHGFAFLADEYATNSGTPPQSFIDEYNEVYEKYGWYSNVDFTDDPSKVRWSAFLSDSRYSSLVGLYEGAALYTQGAWRPTANSIMRDNYGGFNAPSRWAIYKQIMKRSGEDYSWEKFLEYDAVNRGTGDKVPEVPLRTPARSLEPGTPPVIK